ncbi:type I polyketide synthase [Chitinophaga nivalis]|uniref:SDR family NAD(P)-dependent oxidoreductase n=1 Tax=Chitinophaga nivalis TaxID=2991709 RepID=A0ABT3IP79_9BACT|nr:type I polyketide synthase [Chitinophaga nivalis]MCW3464780.1 SDR family NAD(P)-dependent oxidoreductase [Chitinophaga nivalis]MCW3485529.1 SDR family NAD(P)-dependent oxidoreductase [Chitinophaga nivalis]
MNNTTNKPATSLQHGIAIVGMSCRFPGGADSPEAFWDLLQQNKDAMEEIPADRVDLDRYYDAQKGLPGKIYVRQGGFLKDAAAFDAGFFHISPVEAEAMDPHFRVLLELSYEAFEAASIKTNSLQGTNTGVFMGLQSFDFGDVAGDVTSIYSLTGSMKASASGRLSFAYGLHGPGVSMDTACSSTLVAIHLACESLLAGNCQMALAGGANLLFSPKTYIGFCMGGMLSPEGYCKAFDAEGDGFVRSEGAGILLLKRYEDAVKDHNNILAVIAGTAVTNDGATKGFTVPSSAAQEMAIRHSMKKAGVTPDDIDYFEAHGTGTNVGDPLEMIGIGNAFKERTRPEKLLVGSVKTNIGHTEAVSGLAGLIKCILAMQHHCIPANLHFRTPNPGIPWADLPVEIVSHNTDWLPGPKPRYAGVNSFGLSGTNAHITLREAPAPLQHLPEKAPGSLSRAVLPISAADDAALSILIKQYQALLEQQDIPVETLAAAAALRRSDLPVRLCIHATNSAHMQQLLQDALDDPIAQRYANTGENRRIIFVFPGQGAQWLGMGRELMAKEPVFRHAMEACEQAISHFVDWSLIEEINRNETDNRFEEVDVIQPILFAMEVAIARLWESWGVKPAVVIGHSMGEIAGAHIAGALSLKDAANVICKRSELAAGIKGKGAAAVVELNSHEVTDILKGWEKRIAVASYNGPKSTVLSGDREALTTVLQELTEKDIYNKFIRVDFAPHSPQLDPLKPAMLEGVKTLQPQAAKAAIYSTVKNDFIRGELLDATYWVDNFRETVLFLQGIQQLLQDENSIFIEISPHPVLTALITQQIESLNKQGASVVASLSREQPEVAEMLHNFCQAYKYGATIDWTAFYKIPLSAVADVPLPRYPWQHEQYALSHQAVHQDTYVWGHKDYRHTFDAVQMRFAVDPAFICWESEISTRQFPYLEDHVINNVIIFPATGFLEYVLSAGVITFAENRVTIREMQLISPVILADQTIRIQLVFTVEKKERVQFKFFSAVVTTPPTTAPSWELNAQGYLELNNNARPENLVDHWIDDSVLPYIILKEDFYNSHEAIRMQYGKRFRAASEIKFSDTAVWAKIIPDEIITKTAGQYLLHPAMLDACLLAGNALLLEEMKDKKWNYIPIAIQDYQVFDSGRTNGILWVTVHKAPEEEADKITYHINVYNENGYPRAAIRRCTLKKVPLSNLRQVAQNLFALSWLPLDQKAIQVASTPLQKSTCLIFGQKQETSHLVNYLAANGTTVYLVETGVTSPTQVTDAITHISIDTLTPAFYEQLLHDILDKHDDPVLSEIIYFSGAREVTAQTPADTVTTDAMSVISLLQTLSGFKLASSPRLWLITQGAQQIAGTAPVNVWQTGIAGLSREIFLEYPEYDCHQIDMEPDASYPDWKLCGKLLLGSCQEKEYVIREGVVFKHRFTHIIPANKKTDSRSKRIAAGESAPPFQFIVNSPGILESIEATSSERIPPAWGEVEINIKAAGLNFLNLMSALGIYPGVENGYLSLANEFAGIITNVGAGVTAFKVGDRVMGVSFQESFSNFFNSSAQLITVIPDELAFTDAATMPIAYLTAYYAIVEFGKLQPGERILIHTATGGVGMAALYIARMIGTEIYATAGTESKRQWLKDAGIPYIMDSRKTGFAAQISTCTHQEGIDVVLNTLTGDAMLEGLSSLRSFGRFCDISKKDVYDNSHLEMQLFKESTAYFFLDMLKLMSDHPEKISRLLGKIIRFYKEGHFPPISKTVFPASRVAAGFNLMMKGEHMGKIIFDLEDPDLLITHTDPLFSGQATYLITGGMGGLGLITAAWMHKNGARHIVLTGRTAPPATAAAINTLREKGCQVVIQLGDITNYQQVEAILTTLRKEMPPLKGIVHTAGILDDGGMANMEAGKFNAALRPKVDGAWWLHELTAEDELDFFLLYSSVLVTLGAIGQANYVVANSFLDGFARYRRQINKPATSIQWGPIADVGLAAAQDIRGKRMDEAGIWSFSREECEQVLSIIFDNNFTEISAVFLEMDTFFDHQPTSKNYKILDDLIAQSLHQTKNTAKDDLIQTWIDSGTIANAQELAEKQLQSILSLTLKTSASKINTDTPFTNLGIDSMMVVQLRNYIDKLMGISITVASIWKFPKVTLLARHILEVTGVSSKFPEE